MNHKIICKLFNTNRGELMCHIISPVFVSQVPVHRADHNMNGFTNEKELRAFVKDLLIRQIDYMEIDTKSLNDNGVK